MKREELLKGLKAVIPGTADDTVIFDGAWLRSFGGNVSISYPLQTGLNCVVNAEDFFRVVSKMSRDEIELSVKDDKLITNDRRTKLKLNQMPEADYLKLKADLSSLQLENLTWQPLPKGFIENLPLVLLSAGKDKKLGKLAGVVFNGNSILSTDNFKVSFCVMESPLSPEMFRLQTSIVEKIVKTEIPFDSFAFADIGQSAQWIYLRSDNITMCFRVYDRPRDSEDSDDDYPWTKVVSIFGKMGFDEVTEEQELPEEILGSIARIEIMASQSEIDFTTQIDIFKEEDDLMLSATKGSGEVAETVAKWDGTLPGRITASPSFLKQALSLTRKFKISPTGKALLFETSNFRYLILARSK